MKLKPLLLLCTGLCMTVSLWAQRTVTGTVRGSTDNEPIAGASVYIPGTSSGTSTDGKGAYSIEAPDGAKQLVFAATGYATKTVDLGPNNVVDVLMDDNTKELKDVVVTALAIKREKRSLGYATKTVDDKEISDGGQRDALQAIQGQVAGAYITNNGGSPGSSTRIVLRGPRSVSKGNQALIVVDGVPYNNVSRQNDDLLNNQVDFGNRLNDINPNVSGKLRGTPHYDKDV